mgnify:FL=1
MIHFTNQKQFIAHYNAHAADPITESNLLAVMERAVWDDCEAYDIDCDSHRLIKFRGTVEFTDKSGNPFLIHLLKCQEWFKEDGEMVELLKEGFIYEDA